MNSLKKFLILSICLFSASSIFSQKQINVGNFKYLSPVPGSKLNSNETNIIIKYEDAFDKSILVNEANIKIEGSKSGIHKGNIILAEEDRTLIFKSNKEFDDGETVTVEVLKNLKSVSGKKIPSLSFWFKTSEINLNKKLKSDPQRMLKFIQPDFKGASKTEKINKIFNTKSYTLQKDSLPDDFPVPLVDSINNPTAGNIFYTPFIFPGWFSTYLIITDNFGIPIFYRKVNAPTFDFKKADNGKLAYYDIGTNKYYIMNESYEVIDSLMMQGGYLTDLHELILLPDNHAFLMSYDYQQMPMDTVVPGGDTNATVIGIILQELDENKNVVFQWRSWDHYKITDATYDINLTSQQVDYAHSNSIEIDFDGNILLSTRHFDEVTKINRETGEIIWRWGGEYCENNEFTFLNDPIGFSHQHDARRLPNGNIMLFDNGNLHTPPFSRVVEYQLDEENKYATLVWEYKNEPSTFSGAMGSSRRLSNHNTFVGWGTETNPAISEVSADGEVTFFLANPDTVFNYRAFKFHWKTNYFVTNPDSLYFGYVPEGDSLTMEMMVINNSENEIEINGILNRDSAFYVNDSLPVSIPALGSATIQVTFKPYINGNYSDDLHLQWNRPTERIAQVVRLSGTTITSVEDNSNQLSYQLNQNYPNPFNPDTKISFSIPEEGEVKLEVFDILGQKIKTLVNERMIKGNYNFTFNAQSLPSGIYIYKLQVNNFADSRKMILLR